GGGAPLFAECPARALPHRRPAYNGARAAAGLVAGDDEFSPTHRGRSSNPPPHPHLHPPRIEGRGETQGLAGAAVVTALYVEWPGHHSDRIVDAGKVEPVEEIEGLRHQLQAP